MARAKQCAYPPSSHPFHVMCMRKCAAHRTPVAELGLEAEARRLVRPKDETKDLLNDEAEQARLGGGVAIALATAADGQLHVGLNELERQRLAKGNAHLDIGLQAG